MCNKITTVLGFIGIIIIIGAVVYTVIFGDAAVQQHFNNII